MFNPYVLVRLRPDWRSTTALLPTSVKRSFDTLPSRASCHCIELSAVTMSSWLFTEHYYQVPDAEQNLLGHGGSSVAVERYACLASGSERILMSKSSTCAYRCFDKATHREFAVKRLSPTHNILFPYLLSNELDGLLHIKWSNTPRVVKFIEMLGLPTGEAFLVLE